MKNQTKRIEWSYPTSPNADRFGFPGGCWCVEVVTDYMPKAVAAFATWQKARDNADKMGLPWDKFGQNDNPNAGVTQAYPKGRWS